MPSLKHQRPGFAAAPRSGREASILLLAMALRHASAALARLSRRLAHPAARRTTPLPQLEFYAEAGAPEGALYLDGELVGVIEGVRRL